MLIRPYQACSAVPGSRVGPSLARRRSRAAESASSGARVSLSEGGSQTLRADMSVPLGRSQRGVAEDLLHGTKIRASVEKMRGRGMSQIVRRYVRHPGSGGESVDGLSEGTRV